MSICAPYEFVPMKIVPMNLSVAILLLTMLSYIMIICLKGSGRKLVFIEYVLCDRPFDIISFNLILIHCTLHEDMAHTCFIYSYILNVCHRAQQIVRA